MKLLSSEWLKTKRTAIRWLTFGIPVVFSTLIIWYIGLRGVENITQIMIFQLFFEAWTAFFVPLGAGILAGLTVHQEELAGSFNGFLSTKTTRWKLYLGKLTLLVLAAGISTTIAVVVFGAGLKLTLNTSIMWPVFAGAAILIIAGTIPVLSIHLWAGFAWGMGATMGISIGGLLMAALIGATSLGERVWQFVPWAWPVRLAKLSGAYLLFTPDMTKPPEIISSGYVMSQLSTGLIGIAICFILTLAEGILWFNRWEGRKSYE